MTFEITKGTGIIDVNGLFSFLKSCQDLPSFCSGSGPTLLRLLRKVNRHRLEVPITGKHFGTRSVRFKLAGKELCMRAGLFRKVQLES